MDNFPQTFFVGGMVRDLLLHRRIVDIDIATEAGPEQVIKTLADGNVKFDSRHKQFGIIVAKKKHYNIEVASFRKDVYTNNRYPKITFANDPKTDSQRRDFTVNALYLSPKTGKILDFHSGLTDLKKRQIKFIGQAQKRIKQDPLRVVRALRFCLDLNLVLNAAARQAITKHFFEIKKLTASRLESEIAKVKTEKNKKIILKTINRPKLLDKYFLIV